MTQEDKSHPEFELEESRLHQTINHIEALIEEKRQKKPSGGDDWADFNLERQQKAQLEHLRSTLDEPYVGRIDFQEDGYDQAEEFYIGYLGLNGPVRIIDWRAPIANLFYTRNRVQVSYNAPAGAFVGELLLKRHLNIKQRQLLRIIDELDRRSFRESDGTTEDAEPTGILVDPDEYLRLVLEGKRGRELRDVVATIQERQNELIRAKSDQILIIQGAAGSGKTTIALHRVAFLLYPQSDEVRYESKKMLIIGASKVFLQFISQVLPRLGIREVPQLTFAEWVLRLLGRQAPQQVSDATLTDILDKNIPRKQRVAIYRRSRFKGSLQIIPLLDRFVELYRDQFSVPENGLAYFPTGEGSLAMEYHVPAKTVQQMLTQTKDLPANQQRNHVMSAVVDLVIRQHEERYQARVHELIAELESRSADSAQLQRWAELIGPYDDRRIPTEEAIRKRNISSSDLSALVAAVERKRRVAMNSLRVEITRLVREDFDRRWPVLDALQAYTMLVTNSRMLRELTAGVLPWAEAELLIHHGPVGEFHVRMEDLAPLAYLHLVLDGDSRMQPGYDYIVVDEAQDLSPLQMWILRKYSALGAMTILGDLAQSIHSYRGISRWEELNDVFSHDEVQYEEVRQTYRSTFEIMTFANRILESSTLKDKGYSLSEPFRRHGPPVLCSQAKSYDSLIRMIGSQIQKFKEQGYENIAVICKSPAECERVQRSLQSIGETSTAILDSNQDYQTGVVVVPAHVTKGVEFEGCIIANANAENFSSTELDGRILYVSVTRALHGLAVFWMGEPSPHLPTL